MDIEYNHNLSPLTRHVLYRFKQKLQSEQRLKSENKKLQQFVGIIFGFAKTKFNRPQFQSIIKMYDKDLVLTQIDNIFDQLDSDKNDFVFIETFQQALDMISEDDNPFIELNIKSRIRTQNSIPNIAIAFKDCLIRTDDYMQIVNIFVVEEDGFLNQENVKQILANFDFNEMEANQKFINFVFKDKKKISVKQFLQVLGLGEIGTRINIENIPFQKKKSIPSEQMSQQIQQYQKSQIRDNRLSVRESIDSVFLNNSKHYKIDSIPAILHPYFNYGSLLQEPFATYAGEFISAKTIYIDDQNPTSSKASKWVHLVEVCKQYQLFGDFEKLSEVINPMAIKQGGFGDCYFLSAIAAIVQKYPQLVYRLFILEKNPSHIFGVKLFIDGVWRTIPLDGCFPLNHNNYFYGAQPAYNKAKQSQSVWVMLLQKAWAKVYGSYDNIHSGYNEEGLLAISGAPCISFKSKQQGFLQRLFAQQTKGSIITCSTSKDVGQLTEVEQEDLGIFSGHAYTLLKVFPKFLHNNQEIILLKIKNPWGRKGWRKDWSPESNLWTPQLRKKVDYHSETNDGTFFMSYRDFAVYFDYVNISMVSLSFVNSQIHNQSNRFDFYENRFTIRQNEQGNYFFTIYQQNLRKYGKVGVTQKSKSWMFLAKIENPSEDLANSKLTTIACSAQALRNNTIQTTLQPGSYVIVSRVAWKYWNQYSYTLTSYGPNKINFSIGRKAQTPLICKIIESRAQQIGKINGDSSKVYEGLQIGKNYLFDVHSGIGYIKLTSLEEEKLFHSNLSLEPSVGIHILPPHKMPLSIDLVPHESKTYCFLVQPDGMKYSMKQAYKWFK